MTQLTIDFLLGKSILSTEFGAESENDRKS